MKKIMFNDEYGLTAAVLKGKKTQTRRLAKLDELVEYNINYVRTQSWGESILQAFIKNNAAFKVGEVIAIAQKYSEISWDRAIYDKLKKMCDGLLPQYILAGWDNKMFVKADLMPNHIRINDVRLEHIQDITEEDCIKEGVKASKNYNGCYVAGISEGFDNPREAYAALIDSILCKGTWNRNPFVFVYDFELIR